MEKTFTTFAEVEAAAIELMNRFPHLEQHSLDEWLLEHNDVLDEATKREAIAINEAAWRICG